MDAQNFYNGIKTLSDWFNKKLTGIQEDIIFKGIKFIPDMAFKDIVEKYTKKFKPLPSYFPTVEDIVNQWYQWRNENPGSITKFFTQTECDECFGRGLLPCKYIYEPLNGVYETSYRCAKCENWKQHFNNLCKIPFKTRDELLTEPLIVDIWPWKTKGGAR